MSDFSLPIPSSGGRSSARVQGSAEMRGAADGGADGEDLFGDIEPVPLDFAITSPGASGRDATTGHSPAPPSQRPPSTSRPNGRWVKRYGTDSGIVHPDAAWSIVDDAKRAVDALSPTNSDRYVRSLAQLELDEATRRCVAIESDFWFTAQTLAAESVRLSATIASAQLPGVINDEAFERAAIRQTELEDLLVLVHETTLLAVTSGVVRHEEAEREQILKMEASAHFAAVPMLERCSRRGIVDEERGLRARLETSRAHLAPAANLCALERYAREWWARKESDARHNAAIRERYSTALHVVHLDEAYWRVQVCETERREWRRLEVDGLCEGALATAVDTSDTEAKAASTITRFFAMATAKRAARRSIEASKRVRPAEAFEQLMAHNFSTLLSVCA